MPTSYMTSELKAYIFFLNLYLIICYKSVTTVIKYFKYKFSNQQDVKTKKLALLQNTEIVGVLSVLIINLPG